MVSYVIQSKLRAQGDLTQSWTRKMKIGCTRQICVWQTDRHCDSLSSWRSQKINHNFFQFRRVLTGTGDEADDKNKRWQLNSMVISRQLVLETQWFHYDDESICIEWDTGLWLVSTGHVTWILASDWSTYCALSSALLTTIGSSAKLNPLLILRRELMDWQALVPIPCSD